MRVLSNIYRAIFAKRAFYRFNELIFKLSLRGLGVLNYENDKLSGEDFFLRRFTSTLKNPLVLDVGANVGNYSNVVRALCPGATIYAFEPHPKTFVRLQSEASKRGYSSINAGCGEKEEQLQLYDYGGGREYSSHASLYGGVIEEFRKADSVSHTVDIITIDGFVSRAGISKIDLLKIDVEGNELKVIEGAKASIGAGLIDVIQFEFNDVNVVSRSFFRDFYAALSDYDFYRLLPGGLLPLGKYDALMHELFAYQNVVAIRQGSGASLRLRR